MQIKRDKYILGKSETIEILSKSYDVKADIKLFNNTNELNIGSSISGVVVDTSNIPIKNAIIKLMNDKLETLSNTRTDNDGKYVLDIIPSSNIYTVLAIATGKSLSQSPSFSLIGAEHKIINFTLSEDANSKFGAISGVLVDENKNLVNGAVISLYKIINTSNELISITYSDAQGNFVFSELLPGNYKIIISSLTYISSEETISVESRKISSIKKVLNNNTFISDGSVSGVITDKDNITISQADVILYKIDENSVQTPVAFTQTNSSGIYSFANVPFGYYLIKSNASQSIDLSPSLLTPSVKITSTTKIGTYDVSTGILSNGAEIDYSTGFVASLGGVNDGAVTLNINIEKAGLYDLSIEYVSADFNRALKIEVNGTDITDTFNCPLTTGWKASDSKTLTILTTLNEGNNSLKFHGDGINLAPNLDIVTIILNNTESILSFTNANISSTYAAYDISYKINLYYGKFLGNVSYDPISKLVTGLGGSSNSSVTKILEVDDVAMYYMLIQYKATAPNSNLKIDINNTNDGKIYNFPITTDKVGSYTIPIVLKNLKNAIKFYGDGKNPAPDLRKVELILPPVTNKLINGILENEAQIDSTKNFVINIGGKKDGSSTVTVKTNTAGVYDLILNYVGTNSKLSLKIDVNGIFSNTIYTLSITKSNTIKDISTFTIPLRLNLGNNTLKFYGNGKDVSPDLSSFTMNFNKNLTPTIPDELKAEKYYKILNAQLTAPSTFNNKTNLVTSLGGKNNGSCIMTVSVKYSAEYRLSIKYKNFGKFKIDINNVSTNTIYNTSGSYFGIFQTLIKLKAGKSTIKFSGNNTDIAPELGDFSINLNYPINYSLEEEALLDGPEILPNGVITPLGGNSGGEIFMSYFSPEFDEYWLNFIFSSEGGAFLIDTPNEPRGIINKVPSAKSATVPFSIKVKLNEGVNIFHIYGIVENYVPDLYSLDIKPAFTELSRQIYTFTSGRLNDKAEIDLLTNSVINIGISTNSYVTLTVKVDSSDYYDLGVIYVPQIEDSIIKLDINGTYVGSTFTLPKKKIGKFSNFKLFIISKIQLKKGNNTLKFYSPISSTTPQLYKLRVSKYSSSSTISSIYGVYYTKDGKLENGAKIASFSSSFVEGLGGAKQDGSVTIDFTSNTDDLYDLLIEYLVFESNGNLKISINNEDTGTIYMPPKTTALKESAAKTFVVPVLLKIGVNKIKFHGDGSNLAPNLGKIIISKAPQVMTFDILLSTTKNIKDLNSPPGFLTLPDNANSFVLNTVNIDTEGTYYITLQYLCKSDSIITVIINDNQPLEVKLPKTIYESSTYKKAITIKVYFDVGENNIVFLLSKDSSYKSPLLGSFSISNDKIVKTLNGKEALLLNDASNTAYGASLSWSISRLGGRKNGTAIFKDIYIPINGVYNMVLTYFSPETSRPLRLSVNNIPIEETYKFPNTVGPIELRYVATFTIPINLNAGNNTIEFYGDRNSIKGPIITSIALSLKLDSSIKIYNFLDGKLSGDATIDKQTNTITNIGSKNNGEISLTVNIPSKNVYNLELQYKSPKKSSVLLITANNSTITHTLPMTLSNSSNTLEIFPIKLSLNKGNNILRFYGNKKNEGLVLGSFSLVAETNTSMTFTSKNYYDLDLTKGEFLNGADLSVDNLIMGLGGKKDGSFTIEVDLFYDGKYSLIIEYNTSINYDKSIFTLTIDVNDVPTGIIHTLNDVDIFSLEEYEINLDLSEGLNRIKFHGDGKHSSPDIRRVKLILQS